jgi:hypothetical protein
MPDPRLHLSENTPAGGIAAIGGDHGARPRDDFAFGESIYGKMKHGTFAYRRPSA